MADIEINPIDGKLYTTEELSPSVLTGRLRLTDGAAIDPRKGVFIAVTSGGGGGPPATCVTQNNPTNTELLIHSDTTDGSTTFTDNSDNLFTVTAEGNAQHDTAQAKFGASSILLDGTGDYLSMADNANLELSNNDFTIELWVRFNTVASAAFYGRWGATAGERTLFFGYSAGNGLRFTYNTSSDVVNVEDQAWVPSADTWYHVAATRDGADLRFFIDGTQLGSTMDVSTDTLKDATGTWGVGSTKTGLGTQSNFLDGWVDEFRLVISEAKWTSGFTPPTLPYCDVDQCVAQGNPTNTELLIHSRTTDGSTTFTDSSDNGFTVTAVGNTQHDTAQSVFGSTSILFDGTSDALTVPDNAAWYFSTGDFTVDLWVRFNVINSFNMLIGQYDITNERAWQLRYDNGGSRLEVYLSNNGTGASGYFFSWSPSVDTWYHVAVTRSSNTLRAFVDGTEIGTSQTAAIDIRDSSGLLSVGDNTTSGSPTGSQELNGWLDEVRVVKGEAKWTTNFTPPTLPYCDDS